MNRPAEQEFVQHFEELGLSNYEARTYIYLLQNGQCYGNEISKGTGIPSSKIYETVARLVEKGLAYPIKTSPVHYEALPLKEFLNQKQKNVLAVIKTLEDNERLLETSKRSELLWYISGRKNLLDKGRTLIDRAEKEILISMWPEESAVLKENLLEAEARGIEIYSIQFGDTYLEVGKLFKHARAPAIHERHRSELFLAVDRAEGMFMYLEKLGGWKGYHTSSSGIVRVITNYIRHDIYINRFLQDHRDIAIETYGENFERLLI
ncbi:MAG: TrmB family transcriptional regulator [Firmicutes bacterium]|jgi:sugar-specific transcriptional regulator TrmB|nr:TrmB family transcriptional regulator [Bacillota bacterium]